MRVTCWRTALFLGASMGLGACSDNNDGDGGAANPAGGGGPKSCAKSSWIAGTTDICGGHLVYRDYIYDDHGAATFLSPLAPPPYVTYIPAGAARYPASAINTADLVRLDLSLQGHEVLVEFELNTLYEAEQTIAAIAIDSDNNPATGSEKLLGLDLPGADEVHRFTEGDPSTNLIRGSFAKPAGETWKIWAVTAQANGTVMNVAFRGTDETASLGGATDSLPLGQSMMFDEKQAAALMSGDISAFAATVAVEELTRRATRLTQVPPGLHQRVYTSKYTLPPGEGVSVDGVPGVHGATSTPCEQYFNFLGKYQPFVIYLPEKPGPHGLQVRLHGCGAHPVLEVNQRNYQQRFGEDLNVIIASPLGRGPTGFYSGISERDVLDAMDDVIANYEVDEERVLVGGTSMGGYGTLRFAALYPDRFAAATNWVGFPGNFFNTPLPVEIGPLIDQLNVQLGGAIPLQSAVGSHGDMMDYTGNLKHVPTVHLYAALDELVHVTSSLAFGLRLQETPGLEFDFYEHAPAEHVSFVLFDDWQKEALFNKDRRRASNPAHIVFRTDASLAYPEYEIRHDKAYWVSGIVARTVGAAPGEAYSDIDVRSFGCGLPEKQFVSGQDAGFGPVGWFRLFSHVASETPVTAENRLVASLKNVASMSVDMKDACLKPGTAYLIETDGPIEIRFSDGRRLSLAAGTHSGVI